jgi:aspartyl-tRNA(Asn)/glutamyl-tRNA(Gln) amidotransferase subunit A
MTTPDLRRLTDVATLVQSGRLSPIELTEGCLAQIRRRPSLNAFVTVLEERALEQARQLEEELRAGRCRGPLHGIPIALKDLVDLAGTRTTSGSAVPCDVATTDAAVVRRLRDAGAVLIGKTNLHEFAFGTTSE